MKNVIIVHLLRGGPLEKFFPEIEIQLSDCVELARREVSAI
jgi:hypothetical protein